MLQFEEWGAWPFMLVPTFKGAAVVGLGDDGLHVIVTDHDGSTRAVLIPGGSGD